MSTTGSPARMVAGRASNTTTRGSSPGCAPRPPAGAWACAQSGERRSTAPRKALVRMGLPRFCATEYTEKRNAIRCLQRPPVPDLPLIDDDRPALQHDLRLQHAPVAVERVAVEKNDVGEL